MPVIRALAALWGAAALLWTITATAQTVPVITLPDALVRAQTNSPDVLAAQTAVEAAQGRARQAGVRPNPEARFTTEGIGGSGPYRGFGGAETTITLAQPFELGSKRRTRVAAAEAEVAVAELTLQVALADVRRDVRIAYAEALAAQGRVALARDALERAEDLARVARLLVENGREPPFRALRAETALNEARAALAAAEAQQLTAQLELAGLFGDIDPVAASEDDSGIFVIPEAIAGVDQLDVRLADARLTAALLTVDRERALGVPDITAEAGVRRYSDTGDNGFVVGVSIPIPVRDRNRGATSAAAAEARGAQVRRNQALAAATRADREALAALRAAEAQVAALSGTTVPQAREALRLARLGYEAGKFALIDVLDAQAALNMAQSNLVDARLALARAYALLERVRAK